MVKNKPELARVWAEEKPSVRIGKAGVNERVVEEVKRQLKHQRLIKVRFLPAAVAECTFEELVVELATRTSSVPSGRRGFVVVLARKA